MREGGQHLALLVLSAHGLRKERTQLGVDAYRRPWLHSVISASKLAAATLTCTLLRRPHTTSSKNNKNSFFPLKKAIPSYFEGSTSYS